jgi:NAD(P)-dependent dehydrogenase (short-subunit alcohol dehydrogenase family)
MLKKKKVLVVGAAGLLGASLVKELLANDICVIAADISLDRLNSSLGSLGIKLNDTNVFLRKIDLTNVTSVEEMFNQLDGLVGAVNCSYPRNKNYGKKFFEITLEDFNENITLNLGSAFLFMQQCAKYFSRTNEPFSLVNISSVYGVISPKFEIYNNTPMTMPAEYAVIKSSLIHLSKYVTKYVGNSSFRVNLVSPGGIIDNQPASFLEAYKEHTMGKGMLYVDDILGSILYLLSDDSKYVNGQNIIVDDGFTL